MTYSFYLFCKLRDIMLPNELPYDITFDNDIELYNIFLNSKFNNENVGEYECIVNFLQNCKITTLKK